jgi:isoprenylcysteine carboxyl methyltransferase (ICMT) family protein YpbQ
MSVSVWRPAVLALGFFSRHDDYAWFKGLNVAMMIFTEININHFRRLHRNEDEGKQNQQHLANLHHVFYFRTIRVEVLLENEQLFRLNSRYRFALLSVEDWVIAWLGYRF